MFLILPSVLHSLPTQFDLNMRYKFVFNIMQLEFAEFFSFAPVTATRSHPYRLFAPLPGIIPGKGKTCTLCGQNLEYLPAHIVYFSIGPSF